jgi:uncharacterized membrane protein
MPNDRTASDRQGPVARALDQVSRWAPACCLAIVLLGLAIRLLALPHSLWVDEVASVKFADQPWSNLWSDWMRRETNPPLFYSVLKLWTQVAGGSDLALRLPSLFYGCGAMVLAYLLGDKLAGPWAGLAAASLLAVSPAEVQYSLEIRGYGQAQFAALVSLLGLLTFCDADRRRTRWMGLGAYAVGCVAALYSHTMLLLYPAIAAPWVIAWLVVVRRTGKAMVLEWLAANAVILLAWAWWLSITLWQVRHPANLTWIPHPTPSLAVNYVVRTYGPGGWNLRVGAAAVAMLAALGSMVWAHRRRASLVLPLCAVGAPALLFLLSAVTPVMLPRAFFWAVGPCLIAVALGLVAIRSRLLGAALFGLIVLLNLSGVRAYLRRPDPEPYSQIVSQIRAADPTATVVATKAAVAMSLARYCPKPSCGLALMTLKIQESWAVGMPTPHPVATADLPALLACRGRIYTVARGGTGDPTAILRTVADPEDQTQRLMAGKSLVVTRWRRKGGTQVAGGSQCAARSAAP